MTVLLNVLMYQIGWFACVLGAAADRPWLGMGVALLFVGVHVALADEPLCELKLVIAAGAVGLAVDTLQLHLGVFAFRSGQPVAWLSPPWLAVLWMQPSGSFAKGRMVRFI